MTFFSIALSLAAPLIAGSPNADPIQDVSAPPGMVLITQYTFPIGAPIEEVEELVQSDPEMAVNVAPEISHEDTKRRPTTTVAPFFVGITEVTNEQYLAFVRATGSQPPLHWAEPVVLAAATEYNDRVGAERKAALDAGETPPQVDPFDKYIWWDRNWADKPWEMPAELATFPVVNVTYRQATDYADWAGLRLMTEFEFQAAGGRGLDKEGRRYPWGDEWKDGMAVTQEQGDYDDPKPVGSMPQGKSFEVYDLIGNAWEWTSSPYQPLAKSGRDGITVRIGGNRFGSDLPVKAVWNGDQRVVVGGSFAGGRVPARLTTRRPTERNIATEAIGLRCASDLETGRTRTQTLLGSLPPTARFEEDFAPNLAVGRERWASLAGESDVPGYRVIINYERVLFLPLQKLPYREAEGRTRTSLSHASIEIAPVPLGVLDTSVPLIDPKLDPGTYVVAYRAPGKKRGQDEETEEEAAEDAEGEKTQSIRVLGQEDEPIDPLAALVDISKPAILIYSLGGEPLVGWEVAPLEQINNRKEEEVHALDVRVWVEPKNPKKGEVVMPMDTLLLTAVIDSDKVHSDFKLVIPLRVAPNSITDEWRR